MMGNNALFEIPKWESKIFCFGPLKKSASRRGIHAGTALFIRDADYDIGSKNPDQR